MPYYYYFDPTYIVLIPAVIFAFYAQMKVNSAYSRYSRVRNRRGITGAQAARMILDANGLSDVRIEITKGRLSDHYDPKKRVMRLSPEVYGNPSIASVSIAAHESGHAVQHGESYMPLKIRNAIVPVVNIASYMAWPLLIIGLLMGQGTGTLIFDIGVLFFLGVIVFHAITLPVELNASKRAIAQLSSLGIVYPEETAGSKKFYRQQRSLMWRRLQLRYLTL